MLVKLVENLSFFVHCQHLPRFAEKRHHIKVPDRFGARDIPTRILGVRFSQIDAPRAIPQVNNSFWIFLSRPNRNRSLKSMIVMLERQLHAISVKERTPKLPNILRVISIFTL